MLRTKTPRAEKGIWEGNERKVEEARIKYAYDRRGKILQYASALYSFRAKKKHRVKLLSLREELVRFAQVCPVERETLQPGKRAAAMDVLSTILSWMSRRKELPASEQKDLRDLAFECYVRGRRHALNFRRRFGKGMIRDFEYHTECLLELTAGWILLDQPMVWDSTLLKVQKHLRRAARYAPLIEDPKQRQRVYRKLGMLYRMSSQPILGLHWIWGALLIPDVPFRARLKSIAALLGVQD